MLLYQKIKKKCKLANLQLQLNKVDQVKVYYSSIIFADEPTGNLDSKTTDEVMELLKFCVDKYKQTLVMITHNNEIANSADNIINISDGRII